MKRYKKSRSAEVCMVTPCARIPRPDDLSGLAKVGTMILRCMVCSHPIYKEVGDMIMIGEKAAATRAFVMFVCGDCADDYTERCGEVFSPVRNPARRKIDSRNAAVEPLPFVPAMCAVGYMRCGMPSRCARSVMFSGMMRASKPA